MNQRSPHQTVSADTFTAGNATIFVSCDGELIASRSFPIPDMGVDQAKRLIVAIAKHAGIHPEAVSDFMNDITQINPE